MSCIRRCVPPWHLGSRIDGNLAPKEGPTMVGVRGIKNGAPTEGRPDNLGTR